MKKRKPTASQRELAQDWQDLLSRHSRPLERGARSWGVRPQAVNAAAATTAVVQAPRDVFAGMRGVAARRDNPVYTGTAVIGIATMHKSNAVPIFNPDAAVEVAQMRRN